MKSKQRQPQPQQQKAGYIHTLEEIIGKKEKHHLFYKLMKGECTM